jgi:hypothetical protein
MAESKLEALISEIHSWLELHEQLIEYTIGTHSGAPLGVVLALTDKYLRLGSPGGGRNIPLSDIKLIKWSGLWAKLTISTIESKEQLDFLINGKQWKAHAAKMADTWEWSVRQASK